MKAAFISVENSKVEFVKRFFYGFQVLLVSMAIPALFIIGISNDVSKKPAPTESIHEVLTHTQLLANEGVEYNTPGIAMGIIY